MPIFWIDPGDFASEDMPFHTMKHIPRIALALLALALLPGCETVEPNPQKDGARALRQFQFEGLKIGDSPASLKKFTNVKAVPAAITRDPRQVVYEIYQPNEYISLAVAYFTNDRLYKLELRYFDGGSIRTLTKAGGWAYLRDYLVKRFGPPTQTGHKVQVATDQRGINPAFAKANMQWLYPEVQRKLNYIAMYDNGKGVALVTLADTRALAILGQPPRVGSFRASGQPGF